MGQIISELQDLRYLEWSKIRHSSGTAGSFLKSSEKIRSVKYYYKLSDFDPVRGITGHECINEIIADRLLNALDFPHLSYDLIHARIIINDTEYITWLCRSKDFKKKGQSKIALDTYFQMERRRQETPLQFMLRMGWDIYVRQMLTIDHLIQNRDRHGANIEILRDPVTRTIFPAPLFDHGLTLAFSCHSDADLDSFDITKERKIQCFPGSNSTLENIKMIPQDKMFPLPAFDDHMHHYLFHDLTGIVSHKWIDTVWHMICRRADEYENIRIEKRNMQK